MSESSRCSDESSKSAATASRAGSLAGDTAAYDAAIDYLYGRINYEKIGLAAYTSKNYSLDRMRRLTELLGDPQSRFPAVHVAGSKGKGTVSQLVAEILTQSGYRTGFFSSPHLLRLEERFQIDGVEIEPKAFVQAVSKVRSVVEDLESRWPELGRPTFFEMTTAMGLWYFAEQGVELAVLEVGLGGRLDSTNVCSPCLSVITSISLDHQKQLGNTIREIASEKAGIIRAEVPVVCSATHRDARDVVIERCRQFRSRLALIDQDFSTKWHPVAFPVDQAAAGTIHCPTTPFDTRSTACESPSLNSGVAARVTWSCATREQKTSPDPSESVYETRLLGRHQADNIAAAIACVRELREQGRKIPEEAVCEVVGNSQPLARLQVLGHSPVRVLDTAHNPASIEAGIEALGAHLPDRPLTVVFAASGDKDYKSMLQSLTRVANRIILTQYLTNPRAVSVAELRATAEALPNCTFEMKAAASESIDVESSSGDDRVSENRFVACTISVAPSPGEAWSLALSCTEPATGVVYVAGSFFLAAELLEFWQSQGADE